MRTKTTTRAKILSFRRRQPENLVFERIEVDPLLAYFRATESDIEYVFALTYPSLELYDVYRYAGPLGDLPPPDLDVEDHITRLYLLNAQDIAKEQFRTWRELTASERLSLLLTWGEDQLRRVEQELRHVIAHDLPRKNADVIQQLSKEVELQDQYLAGIEAAYLALD